MWGLSKQCRRLNKHWGAPVHDSEVGGPPGRRLRGLGQAASGRHTGSVFRPAAEPGARCPLGGSRCCVLQAFPTKRLAHACERADSKVARVGADKSEDALRHLQGRAVSPSMPCNRTTCLGLLGAAAFLPDATEFVPVNLGKVSHTVLCRCPQRLRGMMLRWEMAKRFG